MRAAWLVLAALAVGASGQTGPAATAVIEADYSNPGLSPSHWTLTLRQDGSGHFRSERGKLPDGGAQIDAADMDRDLKVSAAFAERVFRTARQHQWFNEACESHLKVAFQGWKKLSYVGPEGYGSCIYNYSKDRELQSLGEALSAVAGTLVEGARLEMLLQHDRLGLDKEMEYLSEAAKDGRMQQIGTIREILERLADDENVMERVRKRARTLLTQGES